MGLLSKLELKASAARPKDGGGLSMGNDGRGSTREAKSDRPERAARLFGSIGLPDVGAPSPSVPESELRL